MRWGLPKSWPSLDELGVTVEQALRRIALRGTWELHPDGEGTLLLKWVTTGQRGNPFAPSHAVVGTDLAEVVAEMLAATEPERGGLDWTVPWCLARRAEKAEQDRRYRQRERERRLHEKERDNFERWYWAYRRAERRVAARIAETRRILAPSP